MADEDPPTEYDSIVMFEALASENERAHDALAFDQLTHLPQGGRHRPGYWMQSLQALLLCQFSSATRSRNH